MELEVCAPSTQPVRWLRTVPVVSSCDRRVRLVPVNPDSSDAVHRRRDCNPFDLIFLSVPHAPRSYLMAAIRPEVLFVCVHNAGRSQMAAALLAHHAGDRVAIRSAGTAPADAINPAVVEAMAELGIDLLASGAHPKRLDEAAVKASDVVITMGCGDECPFYPGTRYLDWKLDDPAGQGVDAIRPIRDEIDRRVRDLLAELIPTTT